MELPSAGYLHTMPLHAITELYGEPGLRARFIMETKRFSADEQGRLAQALALADRLHHADRRVREPVMNHLLRVATRIMVHYDVHDAEVVVAALLHDSVEDHGPELGDTTEAALQALADQFTERVAELVRAVTNPEWDPAGDKHQQYREHLAVTLAANPWARVVKVSDFTDNGVGLIHTTGPKVQKSARKYQPFVPILRHVLALSDTPLSEKALTHISLSLIHI